MGKQHASHPAPSLQSPPATRGGMEHEEQNDPVAQSFVSKTLLIGSATTTADSSEGDNREEPVVREEEIDETEVSEEVVVGVARLPKEPKSSVSGPI